MAVPPNQLAIAPSILVLASVGVIVARLIARVDASTGDGPRCGGETARSPVRSARTQPAERSATHSQPVARRMGVLLRFSRLYGREPERICKRCSVRRLRPGHPSGAGRERAPKSESVSARQSDTLRFAPFRRARTNRENTSMRIASRGHAVFASILVALGAQGLLKGDFTAIWQPVPKGVPVRAALAYLCAAVSLASGIGLLSRRAAPYAARVLVVYLVVWTLVFRLPGVLRALAVAVSWEGLSEATVVIAGAWVLYAWFAGEGDRRRLAFATGARGLRGAQRLYGLSMIPFGLAHFAYVKETASLVPPWMPAHVAWVYFTGGAFLAAGVAVLTGAFARLAAALSALQLGLFTLLVWVPVVAAGSKDPFQWSELAVSAAITAAAWVVADSYRGAPRLENGR